MIVRTLEVPRGGAQRRTTSKQDCCTLLHAASKMILNSDLTRLDSFDLTIKSLKSFSFVGNWGTGSDDVGLIQSTKAPKVWDAGLYCGSRLRELALEGRSVCLCWAKSKPKGQMVSICERILPGDRIPVTQPPRRLCMEEACCTEFESSGPLGLMQFHHSRSPVPSVESPGN
jgi:hypothetical protein